jgi:hypothetical protein
MCCALHSGVVDLQVSQKIKDRNKFQCPERRSPRLRVLQTVTRHDSNIVKLS